LLSGSLLNCPPLQPSWQIVTGTNGQDEDEPETCCLEGGLPQSHEQRT
jgi:hypothetical protein